MKMHDFHKLVDPAILERGNACFTRGAVLDLVQNGPNRWAAQVVGSDEYKVEVVLVEGEITESRCNCPYAGGKYCKHEVAVWLAIREDLKREDFARSSGLEQKLFRSDPFSVQVEKAGNKAGKDELLDFIQSVGEKDRGFREAFLLRFAEHLGEDKRALMGRMVQRVIRANAGPKGYLSLAETESVADALRAMLDSHGKSDEFENLRSTMLELLKEASKSAEDYKGHLARLMAELQPKQI